LRPRAGAGTQIGSGNCGESHQITSGDTTKLLKVTRAARAQFRVMPLPHISVIAPTRAGAGTQIGSGNCGKSHQYPIG
jgi:hypothetical protein